MNLMSKTIFKVKGSLNQQSLEKSCSSYNKPTGHLLNLDITRFWQDSADAPTCPVKDPAGGSLTFIVRSFTAVDRDEIGFLVEAIVAKITKPIHPPLATEDDTQPAGAEPKLVEAPPLSQKGIFSFYYNTASDSGFFTSYETDEDYISFPHPDDMNPNLEPMLPVCLLDVVDESELIKPTKPSQPKPAATAT